MNYDARSDADRLAAPLLHWSRLGFLRGFAGMRSDLGPKGRVVLPSAAFHEASLRAVGDPVAVGDDEYRARLAYVNEVEAILQGIQSDVIADHYAKAKQGWAVDLAMGWLIVLLAVVSWYFFGMLHPLTISVLVVLPALSVAVQLVARHRIASAMKAFRMEASEIRMPWQE